MADRGGGCGIFGLIVLALAVFGGYTLYQRYDSNSRGCGAARTWFESSSARYEDLTDEVFTLEPDSASASDIRQVISHLQEGAEWERASDPPELAGPLSASLASYYEMYAQAWAALIEGDDPPYSNAELISAARLITQEQRKINDVCA